MTSPKSETFEARAARLALASSALRPRGDFRERVMLAVLSQQLGWWSLLTPLAARTLPLLLVVVGLTTAVALDAAASVNETLAIGYGSVEVDW